MKKTSFFAGVVRNKALWTLNLGWNWEGTVRALPKNGRKAAFEVDSGLAPSKGLIYDEGRLILVARLAGGRGKDRKGRLVGRMVVGDAKVPSLLSRVMPGDIWSARKTAGTGQKLSDAKDECLRM